MKPRGIASYFLLLMVLSAEFSFIGVLVTKSPYLPYNALQAHHKHRHHSPAAVAQELPAANTKGTPVAVKSVVPTREFDITNAPKSLGTTIVPKPSTVPDSDSAVDAIFAAPHGAMFPASTGRELGTAAMPTEAAISARVPLSREATILTTTASGRGTSQPVATEQLEIPETTKSVTLRTASEEISAGGRPVHGVDRAIVRVEKSTTGSPAFFPDPKRTIALATPPFTHHQNVADFKVIAKDGTLKAPSTYNTGQLPGVESVSMNNPGLSLHAVTLPANGAAITQTAVLGDSKGTSKNTAVRGATTTSTPKITADETATPTSYMLSSDGLPPAFPATEKAAPAVDFARPAPFATADVSGMVKSSAKSILPVKRPSAESISPSIESAALSARAASSTGAAVNMKATTYEQTETSAHAARVQPPSSKYENGEFVTLTEATNAANVAAHTSPVTVPNAGQAGPNTPLTQANSATTVSRRENVLYQPSTVETGGVAATEIVPAIAPPSSSALLTGEIAPESLPSQIPDAVREPAFFATSVAKKPAIHEYYSTPTTRVPYSPEQGSNILRPATAMSNYYSRLKPTGMNVGSFPPAGSVNIRIEENSKTSVVGRIPVADAATVGTGGSVMARNQETIQVPGKLGASQQIPAGTVNLKAMTSTTEAEPRPGYTISSQWVAPASFPTAASTGERTNAVSSSAEVASATSRTAATSTGTAAISEMQGRQIISQTGPKLTFDTPLSTEGSKVKVAAPLFLQTETSPSVKIANTQASSSLAGLAAEYTSQIESAHTSIIGVTPMAEAEARRGRQGAAATPAVQRNKQFPASTPANESTLAEIRTFTPPTRLTLKSESTKAPVGYTLSSAGISLPSPLTKDQGIPATLDAVGPITSLEASSATNSAGALTAVEDMLTSRSTSAATTEANPTIHAGTRPSATAIKPRLQGVQEAFISAGGSALASSSRNVGDSITAQRHSPIQSGSLVEVGDTPANSAPASAALASPAQIRSAASPEREMHQEIKADTGQATPNETVTSLARERPLTWVSGTEPLQFRPDGLVTGSTAESNYIESDVGDARLSLPTLPQRAERGDEKLDPVDRTGYSTQAQLFQTLTPDGSVETAKYTASLPASATASAGAAHAFTDGAPAGAKPSQKLKAEGAGSSALAAGLASASSSALLGPISTKYIVSAPNALTREEGLIRVPGTSQSMDTNAGDAFFSTADADVTPTAINLKRTEKRMPDVTKTWSLLTAVEPAASKQQGNAPTIVAPKNPASFTGAPLAPTQEATKVLFSGTTQDTGSTHILAGAGSAEQGLYGISAPLRDSALPAGTAKGVNAAGQATSIRTELLQAYKPAGASSLTGAAPLSQAINNAKREIGTLRSNVPVTEQPKNSYSTNAGIIRADTNDPTDIGSTIKTANTKSSSLRTVVRQNVLTEVGNAGSLSPAASAVRETEASEGGGRAQDASYVTLTKLRPDIEELTGPRRATKSTLRTIENNIDTSAPAGSTLSSLEITPAIESISPGPLVTAGTASSSVMAGIHATSEYTTTQDSNARLRAESMPTSSTSLAGSASAPLSAAIVFTPTTGATQTDGAPVMLSSVSAEGSSSNSIGATSTKGASPMASVAIRTGIRPQSKISQRPSSLSQSDTTAFPAAPSIPGRIFDSVNPTSSSPQQTIRDTTVNNLHPVVGSKASDFTDRTRLGRRSSALVQLDRTPVKSEDESANSMSAAELVAATHKDNTANEAVPGNSIKVDDIGTLAGLLRKSTVANTVSESAAYNALTQSKTGGKTPVEIITAGETVGGQTAISGTINSALPSNSLLQGPEAKQLRLRSEKAGIRTEGSTYASEVTTTDMLSSASLRSGSSPIASQERFPGPYRKASPASSRTEKISGESRTSHATGIRLAADGMGRTLASEAGSAKAVPSAAVHSTQTILFAPKETQSSGQGLSDEPLRFAPVSAAATSVSTSEGTMERQQKYILEESGAGSMTAGAAANSAQQSASSDAVNLPITSGKAAIAASATTANDAGSTIPVAPLSSAIISNKDFGGIEGTPALSQQGTAIPALPERVADNEVMTTHMRSAAALHSALQTRVHRPASVFISPSAGATSKTDSTQTVTQKGVPETEQHTRISSAQVARSTRPASLVLGGTMQTVAVPTKLTAADEQTSKLASKRASSTKLTTLAAPERTATGFTTKSVEYIPAETLTGVMTKKTRENFASAEDVVPHTFTGEKTAASTKVADRATRGTSAQVVHLVGPNAELSEAGQTTVPSKPLTTDLKAIESAFTSAGSGTYGLSSPVFPLPSLATIPQSLLRGSEKASSAAVGVIGRTHAPQIPAPSNVRLSAQRMKRDLSSEEGVQKVASAAIVRNAPTLVMSQKSISTAKQATPPQPPSIPLALESSAAPSANTATDFILTSDFAAAEPGVQVKAGGKVSTSALPGIASEAEAELRTAAKVEVAAGATMGADAYSTAAGAPVFSAVPSNTPVPGDQATSAVSLAGTAGIIPAESSAFTPTYVQSAPAVPYAPQARETRSERARSSATAGDAASNTPAKLRPTYVQQTGIHVQRSESVSGSSSAASSTLAAAKQTMPNYPGTITSGRAASPFTRSNSSDLGSEVSVSHSSGGGNSTSFQDYTQAESMAGVMREGAAVNSASAVTSTPEAVMQLGAAGTAEETGSAIRGRNFNYEENSLPVTSDDQSNTAVPDGAMSSAQPTIRTDSIISAGDTPTSVIRPGLYFTGVHSHPQAHAPVTAETASPASAGATSTIDVDQRLPQTSAPLSVQDMRISPMSAVGSARSAFSSIGGTTQTLFTTPKQTTESRQRISNDSPKIVSSSTELPEAAPSKSVGWMVTSSPYHMLLETGPPVIDGSEASSTSGAAIGASEAVTETGVAPRAKVSAYTPGRLEITSEGIGTPITSVAPSNAVFHEIARVSRLPLPEATGPLPREGATARTEAPNYLPTLAGVLSAPDARAPGSARVSSSVAAGATSTNQTAQAVTSHGVLLNTQEMLSQASTTRPSTVASPTSVGASKIMVITPEAVANGRTATSDVPQTSASAAKSVAAPPPNIISRFVPTPTTYATQETAARFTAEEAASSFLSAEAAGHSVITHPGITGNAELTDSTTTRADTSSKSAGAPVTSALLSNTAISDVRRTSAMPQPEIAPLTQAGGAAARKIKSTIMSSASFPSAPEARAPESEETTTSATAGATAGTHAAETTTTIKSRLTAQGVQGSLSLPAGSTTAVSSANGGPVQPTLIAPKGPTSGTGEILPDAPSSSSTVAGSAPDGSYYRQGRIITSYQDYGPAKTVTAQIDATQTSVPNGIRLAVQGEQRRPVFMSGVGQATSTALSEAAQTMFSARNKTAPTVRAILKNPRRTVSLPVESAAGISTDGKDRSTDYVAAEIGAGVMREVDAGKESSAAASGVATLPGIASSAAVQTSSTPGAGAWSRDKSAPITFAVTSNPVNPEVGIMSAVSQVEAGSTTGTESSAASKSSAINTFSAVGFSPVSSGIFPQTIEYGHAEGTYSASSGPTATTYADQTLTPTDLQQAQNMERPASTAAKATMVSSPTEQAVHPFFGQAKQIGGFAMSTNAAKRSAPVTSPTGVAAVQTTGVYITGSPYVQSKPDPKVMTEVAVVNSSSAAALDAPTEITTANRAVIPSSSSIGAPAPVLSVAPSNTVVRKLSRTSALPAVKTGSIVESGLAASNTNTATYALAPPGFPRASSATEMQGRAERYASKTSLATLGAAARTDAARSKSLSFVPLTAKEALGHVASVADSRRSASSAAAGTSTMLAAPEATATENQTARETEPGSSLHSVGSTGPDFKAANVDGISTPHAKLIPGVAGLSSQDAGTPSAASEQRTGFPVGAISAGSAATAASISNAASKITRAGPYEQRAIGERLILRGIPEVSMSEAALSSSVLKQGQMASTTTSTSKHVAANVDSAVIDVPVSAFVRPTTRGGMVPGKSVLTPAAAGSTAANRASSTFGLPSDDSPSATFATAAQAPAPASARVSPSATTEATAITYSPSKQILQSSWPPAYGKHERFVSEDGSTTVAGSTSGGTTESYLATPFQSVSSTRSNEESAPTSSVMVTPDPLGGSGTQGMTDGRQVSFSTSAAGFALPKKAQNRATAEELTRIETIGYAGLAGAGSPSTSIAQASTLAPRSGITSKVTTVGRTSLVSQGSTTTKANPTPYAPTSAGVPPKLFVSNTPESEAAKAASSAAALAPHTPNGITTQTANGPILAANPTSTSYATAVGPPRFGFPEMTATTTKNSGLTTIATDAGMEGGVLPNFMRPAGSALSASSTTAGAQITRPAAHALEAGLAVHPATATGIATLMQMENGTTISVLTNKIKGSSLGAAGAGSPMTPAIPLRNFVQDAGGIAAPLQIKSVGSKAQVAAAESAIGATGVIPPAGESSSSKIILPANSVESVNAASSDAAAAAAEEADLAPTPNGDELEAGGVERYSAAVSQSAEVASLAREVPSTKSMLDYMATGEYVQRMTSAVPAGSALAREGSTPFTTAENSGNNIGSSSLIAVTNDGTRSTGTIATSATSAPALQPVANALSPPSAADGAVGQAATGSSPTTRQVSYALSSEDVTPTSAATNAQAEVVGTPLFRASNNAVSKSTGEATSMPTAIAAPQKINSIPSSTIFAAESAGVASSSIAQAIDTAERTPQSTLIGANAIVGTPSISAQPARSAGMVTSAPASSQMRSQTAFVTRENGGLAVTTGMPGGSVPAAARSTTLTQSLNAASAAAQASPLTVVDVRQAATNAPSVSAVPPISLSPQATKLEVPSPTRTANPTARGSATATQTLALYSQSQVNNPPTSPTTGPQASALGPATNVFSAPSEATTTAHFRRALTVTDAQNELKGIPTRTASGLESARAVASATEGGKVTEGVAYISQETGALETADERLSAAIQVQAASATDQMTVRGPAAKVAPPNLLSAQGHIEASDLAAKASPVVRPQVVAAAYKIPVSSAAERVTTSETTPVTRNDAQETASDVSPILQSAGDAAASIPAEGTSDSSEYYDDEIDGC